MKKLLLLPVTILLSYAGFAQKASRTTHTLQPVSTVAGNSIFTNNTGTARTTAIGDTIQMSNIAAGNSLVIYKAGTNDSDGYLTGTDVWNDMAFAERYDVNGADSSVKIIGVVAQFAGVVNPASTQTINFNAWNMGPQEVITGSLSYQGFPGDILDSVTVPLTQLGIGTTADTMKTWLFDSATITLQSSFFVGYSINYNFNSLNGDTIGLAGTMNGVWNGTAYTPYVNISDLGDTALDTVINVQNATLGSDNNWYDNYTQNDSIRNDLAIFPIVVVGMPTGIKGITKNDLTFFGNYPNPATDNTNIKFSLATTTDVSIQIMDMAGHTLNTITQTNLSTGIHIIPVNTAAMAAGNYLYLVRTANGDGMAGELTVMR